MCKNMLIVYCVPKHALVNFQKDDDDVITLEGSVSDYTSFKSGSADAFDPDV